MVARKWIDPAPITTLFVLILKLPLKRYTYVEFRVIAD